MPGIVALNKLAVYPLDLPRSHAAVQPVVTGKDLAIHLLEEQRIVNILQQSRYQPLWASARSDTRKSRLVRELESLIRKNLPEEIHITTHSTKLGR